jgi:predicted XRE-type DNA-binding protein
MQLKTWLDEERGRYTALATHLGVTVSRVSQMADDGVPPKFMLSVRTFTGDAVTLEDLVEARTPGHTSSAQAA